MTFTNSEPIERKTAGDKKLRNQRHRLKEIWSGAATSMAAEEDLA